MVQNEFDNQFRIELERVLCETQLLENNNESTYLIITHLIECIREGSYIVFGAKSNGDLLVSSNVFEIPDERLSQAISRSIADDEESRGLITAHINYLKSSMTNVPGE